MARLDGETSKGDVSLSVGINQTFANINGLIIWTVLESNAKSKQNFQ